MTVIQFPDTSDLDKVTYIDNEGDLGVCMRDRRLQVLRLNDKEFMVITPNGSQVHDRQTLAELFWVGAIFLDSEEKWKPELDLIGCDY